ncbi:TyrS-associated PheT N-terminal domain-related protein TapR [Mycoplasmopsis adleri]|uniref:TyrS-associated PheT N-terminal domain-related protein TapR n=1 Tax=Mycoplasmopsis adleri TaxID=51362 RepID=UPI003872BA20
MSIYFNINDKFKDTLIIYYDSRINTTKEDYYENYVVFRDEKFNVKSVNVLNYPEAKEYSHFGLLNYKTDENIKKDLLKLNSNYHFNDDLNYFRIGKIIKREAHPKSEKLFVLQVDFKDEVKQIITNTLYTLENKYFVWCMPGSITSKGLEIKDGEVMGVKSLGMLCSSESLDLNEKKTNEFAEFLNKCNDNFLGKNIFEVLNWK